MRGEVVPVCSPALRQRQRIATPADVAGLTLLHQTTRPTLWADWFEQEGVPAPQALRGPRFEQFAMIAQAAISGLGAALLPRFLMEEELASGALVELPGGVMTSSDAYYLVVPLARAQVPGVRAFRQWMRGMAGQPT
jgi:LysR family glycine cleavage system transcriptional activator